MAIPTFADVYIIDLADELGVLRRVEVAGCVEEALDAFRRMAPRTDQELAGHGGPPDAALGAPGAAPAAVKLEIAEDAERLRLFER